MNPKTLLITTVLGIATTAAFGAASLRAPQIGGTATVTTPTATNTARAGTMRAQTMKTSSISAPVSVTTTQSIATPVSTETTDARIALLKGIKGFNPGKVKDTAAATSELNSLNDRIEELTAQLDRAEAAQSTVLTESNLDAKIDEKLSALGTSTSTKETYSKEEIDNLLTALEKKLPKIDDRGTMTVSDPNGDLVAIPAYWINLTYISNLDFDLAGHIIHYGMTYTYETNKSDAAIQQYISNTVCKDETTDWCWITGINNTNPNNKYVSVIRHYHDYGIAGTPIYWSSDPSSPFFNPETNDTTHTVYWTFENSPEWFIRESVCGTRPESECFVATPGTQAHFGWGSNGTSQMLDGKEMHFVEIVERGQYTGNKFNSSLVWEGFHLVNHYWVSAIPSVTESEINAYVSEFCNGESSFYCYILNGEITTLPSGTKQFMVVKRLHGYGLLDSHIIQDGGNILYNKIFYTNEANPSTYIHDTICGNKPQSECYVAEWWNMMEIQPSTAEQDARYQVSVIEVPIAPNPDPGTATSGYIPLR